MFEKKLTSILQNLPYHVNHWCSMYKLCNIWSLECCKWKDNNMIASFSIVLILWEFEVKKVIFFSFFQNDKAALGVLTIDDFAPSREWHRNRYKEAKKAKIQKIFEHWNKCGSLGQNLWCNNLTLCDISSVYGLNWKQNYIGNVNKILLIIHH